MTSPVTLTKLYLRDYRSYSELLFEPAAGVNVLLGPNAAGKTNLLEAINYLSTLRSPRTARDADMIRHGSDTFYVKGQFQGRGPAHTLEVGYRSGKGRALRIDGVPVKRASDFRGRVNSVFFSPDDLGLVKGGPGNRRDFIDSEISQVDRGYGRALDAYARILSQRNDALKHFKIRKTPEISARAQLEPWDAQLVDVASAIVSRRVDHLGAWIDLAREVYCDLSGGSEELTAEYRSGYTPDIELGEGRSQVPTSRDDLAARLKDGLSRTREEERVRGYTVVGPHRDDLGLLIDGRDARTFGSQGQQRSVTLAIKVSEVSWMRKESRREPILLLDDVVSELDSDRTARLAHLLDGGSQTMITSTHVDEGIVERSHPRIWRICGGGLLERG